MAHVFAQPRSGNCRYGFDLKSCAWFIAGLAERIDGYFQLTSDAFYLYQGVVSAFLGKRIDYAQVIKVFGRAPETGIGRYSPPVCTGCRTKKIIGKPDERYISTSYTERNNLNIRMHQRRMTRLTNAFSKKIENHAHAMALHFMYYISSVSIRRLRQRPRWPLG